MKEKLKDLKVNRYIGSVIIGIAANYPLHFLAHIRQGYSCQQSIADVAAPLLTGNITTIGAFLSLLFISSGAMHDLGLFALSIPNSSQP